MALKWLLVLFVSALPRIVLSQQLDSMAFIHLDEIVFRDLKYNNNFCWSSHQDSVVSSDLFAPNFDVLLNRMPGVVSINNENTAQDIRVSIRGFGARSAFGIRGIKLYMDGIPLTTPDGTSQVDELSLFSIHGVDVIRSNFSARLGNAGGGAIALKSEPYYNGVSAKAKLHNQGSYDGGFSMGFKKKKQAHFLSVNHHKFKGQREHAEGKNTVLYQKSRYEVSKRWLLETFIQGHLSPEGKDPGALNTVEFSTNPFMANPRNITYDAGEEVQGVQASIKSSLQINDRQALHSSLYYKYRDFVGRLPFQPGGWVTIKRQFIGFQNAWEFSPGLKNRFTLGNGMEWQADQRARFQNDLGTKGLQDVNQLEKVQNLFFFQQWNYSNKNWGFHQLARFDIFGFDVRDRFLEDGLNNGEIKFSTFQIASGFYYQFSDSWKSFLNGGTGFETPTLNEYSNNPEGNSGFNQNLHPEKSIQLEWGNQVHFTPFWEANANFFLVFLQDMITGYEIESFPGRTFYQNASKVKRSGFEFNTSYVLPHKLKISMQYNWSEFVFTEFNQKGKDLSGKISPLTPKHRCTVSAMYQLKNWMAFTSQFTYQSYSFVDDANLTRFPSQSNLLFVIESGNKLWKAGTFGLHFNNVFHLTKYSNIRANASLGRYYEAASPPGVAVFVTYCFEKI